MFGSSYVLFSREPVTVFLISSLLLLSAIVYVKTAKTIKVPELPLPSYVGKACRANDPNLNECVVRTGQPVIRRITQGDPKYRIPKLEPLTISQMKIVQGTKSVGMTMECYECQLYGLSDVNFTAARVDLKNRHVEWDFHLDRLMFLGKYKVSGQVLILPIIGDGDANITLHDVDFSFYYDYDLEMKENRKNYFKITNSTLLHNIGGMFIELKNLFNGDKFLGSLDGMLYQRIISKCDTMIRNDLVQEDVGPTHQRHNTEPDETNMGVLGTNMNRFLNENWKDIIKEVAPAVADALAQVFRTTIGSMAELVPFEYIFPSD
ncbi:hypothetical protein PGB90_001286 [Kerria lacca]